MKNSLAIFSLCAAASAAIPCFASATTSGPSLTDRMQNPWFVSIGTFAGNSELGTVFDASSQYSSCGGVPMSSPDIALFESMGLELGMGYEAALAPVDLRFSGRVETFGPTNNNELGRPHSIFGVDALFRSNQLYFGPGVGVGYASARTSGLTFQGAPTQVFSAVVGYDASATAFAEARLQTAPVNDYKVASVSFGLRF
jgi:hypothetical protein